MPNQMIVLLSLVGRHLHFAISNEKSAVVVVLNIYATQVDFTVVYPANNLVQCVAASNKWLCFGATFVKWHRNEF